MKMVLANLICRFLFADKKNVMKKEIVINEKSLVNLRKHAYKQKDKRASSLMPKNDDFAQKDKYIIAADGDNNGFFHITESTRANFNVINSISFTVDEKYYFDEDEYKEWWEYYDTKEEYLQSCAKYDVEAYDNDGHTIEYFSGNKDDIEDYFQDYPKIAKMIINKDAYERDNIYWITDIRYMMLSEENIDINDVDAVNNAAKMMSSQNGESGYILTDGDIITFHDHSQIQSVCNGMTISKFLELGNIRYGNGNTVKIQLIKEPTFSQQSKLKYILSNANEVVVDFAEPNERNGMYPDVVHSVTYQNPNKNRVVNDIIYYFLDGIKPQGNYSYESKAKNGKIILENEQVDLMALAKNEFGVTSNLKQAGYILPDGTLLNFGSYGYRETDHRAIEGIYTSNNIKIWNDEYRFNYVVDFMNHGAIRCCLNGGILDMTKEPTSQQYYVIKNFVRKAGDLDIDFTNNIGDVECSASYSNANPQRVVADISRYYNDGIRPQGDMDMYESFNGSEVMDENIETEVEANDVSLSSFKKQYSLAPKIWKNDSTLNSKVRLKLLDIADDFWDSVGVTWIKRKGIYLTGSICNYNWSKFSDIDLHIIVDFSEVDEKTDFVSEYFNSKKNEWNSEHSKLKIYGFPVELYIEDVNAETASNGIYDLEENKWVKKPKKEDIDEICLDKYEIKKVSAKLMTKIDDLWDEFEDTDDRVKLRDIGKRSHKLLNKIKRMRKYGLERSGESDSFNIIYKVMRRMGYLDKIWELNSNLYDKINTIGIDENSIKNVLKNIKSIISEEVVADGNATHNPYKDKWKQERQILKDYLVNYGEIMTSKENGKLYKVIYDEFISGLLGVNYCICIQWDTLTMEPGNIIYVRAFDKFTRRMFKPQFDTRGYDNMAGTSDDVV